VERGLTFCGAAGLGPVDAFRHTYRPRYLLTHCYLPLLFYLFFNKKIDCRYQQSVGKTSLMNRYSTGNTGQYKTTIGAKLLSKIAVTVPRTGGARRVCFKFGIRPVRTLPIVGRWLLSRCRCHFGFTTLPILIRLEHLDHWRFFKSSRRDGCTGAVFPFCLCWEIKWTR
jgi:hypothetical protein